MIWNFTNGYKEYFFPDNTQENKEWSIDIEINVEACIFIIMIPKTIKGNIVNIDFEWGLQQIRVKTENLESGTVCIIYLCK